jgi:DNA-binding transcriptional regulator YdaS (Cro superfamily)
MDEHTLLRKRVAEAVVQHFGTQTRVAHILGYHDLRNATHWTTGKRWFPPKHCVTLERESNLALTRQFLRPLDYTEHWPDLPAPKKARPTKSAA